MKKRPRLYASADSRLAAAGSSAPAGVLAGSAHPPVLDAGALARLAELDPRGHNRLLDRVMRAFQSSVARLRPQADAARTTNDRSALQLVVHTLKSSSASIGALQLSQLCAQIESTLRSKDAADLDGADWPAQLHALDAELDTVLAAIDNFLQERA